MTDNLDYICAKYGQEIKGDETLIQKALGVLQEDGLFAFILYLESKKEKNNILSESANLLNEIKLTREATINNISKKVQEITNNIDNMFLAKDLLERTLVYARYHAKSLTKKE